MKLLKNIKKLLGWLRIKNNNVSDNYKVNLIERTK